MIKEPLEKMIREAYFGGNVNTFGTMKEIPLDEGYHYDLNYQYPNPMKKSMTKAEPIISNNTDLNYYKGFVFAKIIPPKVDNLKIVYIKHREVDARVSGTRTKFYRCILTDELHQAIGDNYKAEIVWGRNLPETGLPEE
jgi:hypothetical protein